MESNGEDKFLAQSTWIDRMPEKWTVLWIGLKHVGIQIALPILFDNSQISHGKRFDASQYFHTFPEQHLHASASPFPFLF